MPDQAALVVSIKLPTLLNPNFAEIWTTGFKRGFSEDPAQATEFSSNKACG